MLVKPPQRSRSPGNPGEDFGVYFVEGLGEHEGMNAKGPPAAIRRAPLTFEDMLLLLMRRLLVPVAISTAATAAVIMLLSGGVPLGGGIDLLFLYLLVPGALYGAAILFVGIPAGYLVARLGLSFAESLTLLVLVGYGAVLLPTMVFAGAFALVIAFFGAFAAGVWTFVNADLFRAGNKGA